MSLTQRLALVPRDGLACRDGRGWAPIGGGRGHALDWPWPSTVLGALRTAVGRACEERPGRTFGREDWAKLASDVRLAKLFVLHRGRGDKGYRRLWPRPLDALAFEGADDLVRLGPQPAELPTLGRADDPVREALWRPRLDDPRKPTPLPGWWGEEDFTRWLVGGSLRLGELRLRSPARRIQNHVGIDGATLTAREGSLFSEDVLETNERDAFWAIGVEVEAPEALHHRHLTLGADRRLVALDPLSDEAAIFSCPKDLTQAGTGPWRGLRLICVTPASVERGWLPDGFEVGEGVYRGRLPGLAHEVILRAALVGRPLSVSGWDLAKGRPKPTERMVPPAPSIASFEAMANRSKKARCRRSGSPRSADAQTRVSAGSFPASGLMWIRPCSVAPV